MENTDLKWRKSVASSNGGDTCVEVASDGDHTFVRDTTRREAAQLTVTTSAWRVFVTEVTNNEQ